MKNLNEITLNGIIAEVGSEVFIRRLSHMLDNKDLENLLNGKILSVLAYDAKAVANAVIESFPSRSLCNVHIIEVTLNGRDNDRVYVRYTYSSTDNPIERRDGDPITITDEMGIVFEKV